MKKNTAPILFLVLIILSLTFGLAVKPGRGCCYNSSLGIFDKGVMESNCNAEWDDDDNCNLPGANLGCCVLGEDTVFETLGQCEVESLVLAIGEEATVDWRNDVSEIECAKKGAAEKEGACVFSDGDCKTSSQVSCLEDGGTFYNGQLCTSPEVGSSCEMTEETRCEGDKVYFVDSCGNTANIYDSSRINDETYWKNLFSWEESCGANDENGNAKSSSCGNCDLIDGGFCSSALEDEFSVDVGNFYCKPTYCEVDGVRHENGESWCGYDDPIGNGDDAAGGRYFRNVCSQGVVQTEACADMRDEICAPVEDVNIDGTPILSAECVENDWQSCIELNDGGTVGECNENEACLSKHIEFSQFLVDACVPQYPSGADWKDEEVSANSEEYCGLATQECIVVYKRSWGGGSFKCKENCECEEEIFTEKMNDLCRSLGDCGAYINIAGEFTDGGYEVDGAPRISGISEEEEGVVDEVSADAPLNIVAGGNGGLSANLLSKIKDKITGAKIKKVVVSFECKPWVAPESGDCSLCNGDPMKPCSEYRCHSLGSNCEIADLGGEFELCTNGGASTYSPLIIEPLMEAASWNVNYEDVSESGFSLVGIDGGCLDANLPLSFGVSTNQPANCKFDLEEGDFENMSYDLGSQDFSLNHFADFELPNPAHQDYYGDEDDENFEKWDGRVSFYVKCKDLFGETNPDNYKIDLCASEGEGGKDVSGPLINLGGKSGTTYVSVDADSYNASVFTNELSTCKWDYEDVEYYRMSYDLECDDVLGVKSSPYGYECNYNFPVENDSATYYVRCMDQPWINVSECGGIETIGCGGNANEESTIVRFVKPDSKISIDRIKPDGDFEVGTEMASVELKVLTKGGALNHTCSYSFSGYEDMTRILDESGVTHTTLLNVEPGEKKIYIECQDETGDTARNYTSFKITRDSSSPGISRVWQNGGNVNLILWEEGECRYSTKNCGFVWDEGEVIGSGTELGFSGVRGERYYIKCQDEFLNVPNGCSLDLIAV